MKRLLLIGFYIAVIIAVWSNRTELIAWMRDGDVPVLLLLLLVIGLACIPIIPFSVVIGTMGYLYGPLLGALISLIGAWIAALLLYGLFRYALRERGRAMLRRYQLTERWTVMVEKYPFRSIVLARLMPIVPQVAVNIYAAVVTIPFLSYAGASFLGKIPGMLVFAFIGGSVVSGWQSLLLAAAVYIVFLLTVYVAIRWWNAREA
ncbi:TVP38/TMEM64 family protein [Paenibacillus albus]|uniref:TVP38/TMEM64 family membrane protein n=1 Tax=Paenibacillus albus TaxID=2495582 RepID=A0A3Q8X5G2_9BACL|nr:VTT domain-containing protein [Paenibacillus albus]AZN40956.1 TVP38/TMEM64 family protein [Paenibacillus albus]